MKRIFCVLSLAFFVLSLICGAVYGGLFVWEMVKRVRGAKEAAMSKLRELVAED